MQNNEIKSKSLKGACFLYINTGMDNCFNTRINACLYIIELNDYILNTKKDD